MSCGCNGPMVGGKRKKNRRGTRNIKMRGGNEGVNVEKVNVEKVNVEKGYFDTIKGLVGHASSWLKDKIKTQDSNQPLPVQPLPVQPLPVQSAGRSRKKGGSCVYSDENRQYKKSKKSNKSNKSKKSRKSTKSRKSRK
jgi:hypothetical protein